MRTPWRHLLPALLLLVPAAGPERADTPPPVVPGYLRFRGATPAERIESGRILLSELNCTACHTADAGTRKDLSPKQAPLLSDAGARLRPEWIVRWLTSPHEVKAGTTMPYLLEGREKDAKPLMHYLMSLKGTAPLPRRTGSPAKGKDLFSQIGCVSCHAAPGAKDATGIPLGVPADKYDSASALSHFLENPQRWRPSGRMPKLNLKREEAVAIASHLVGVNRDPRSPETPGETQPGLVFEYYEGSWQKIPDFEALMPVLEGTTTKIGYENKKKSDRIGFRFHGYLEIEKDGMYTFYTNSDDGSALTIGDLRVVDNDGIHGGVEVSGAIYLKKGKHALKVECFEQGGGEHCHVHYEGPGFKKRLLPPERLSHHPSRKYVYTPTPAAGGFTPDPRLVKQGRMAFVARRCIACHEVPRRIQAPPAPALAALKNGAGKGCLSADPPQGAADYGLSDEQKEDLAAALAAPARPASTPEARVHRTMRTLNCYACHERDGLGGPEKSRLDRFTGTEQTVGDEGRIPPRLDDVGAKLTPHALREVLTKGTKVRPYMRTRMPVFGDRQVDHLVEDFARAEKLVTVDPQPRNADHLKNGRLLVGDKGLNCVTCHTWNTMKTPGIQAMDLVHMPTRLRRDWFNRYMVNPMGLRPGTRMPTYWPDGRGVLKNVYEGDPPRQLEAIWQYLSEGGKARRPRGIGPPEIMLEPKSEALIYRNFIQGLTPRGIGVGFPERAHLAFDANEMRIALIWQGDFIDASKHWVGRGPGFQPPAGDKVLKLHGGAPFARLADANAAWPEDVGRKAGYAFGGYRLDPTRRPTFLYAYSGIEIEDFTAAAAAPTGPSLRRTMTLRAKQAPADLWYRVATGRSLRVDAGGFVVDDTLRIRVKSAEKPTLKKIGNGFELRVPVTFAGETARIEIEYIW